MQPQVLSATPQSKKNIVALLSTAIGLPTNIASYISSITTAITSATKPSTTERAAYYELAICSSNLSDVWDFALENLPSGSTTMSLLTLSEEIKALKVRTDKNEEIAFKATERIKNITTKVAQLTVAEVITRHQVVESMLRFHNLNNIEGFRAAARPRKEELVRSLTNKISPHCNYEITSFTIKTIPKTI